MLAIKFCGITTLADAVAALEAGATMLGLNFYSPSPRYLPPAACAKLMHDLAAEIGADLFREIGKVGVFVNMLPVQINAIMQLCQLDLAQLAGDEPPETLQALKGRAFKVIRGSPAGSGDEAQQPVKPGQSYRGVELQYPALDKPPAYLVDGAFVGAVSSQPEPGKQYGGTGVTADWSQARQLAARFPILLAGGLYAGNVAEAIRQVLPWGVDVASGIECAPGRKDKQKMIEFVQAVRLAENSL